MMEDLMERSNRQRRLMVLEWDTWSFAATYRQRVDGGGMSLNHLTWAVRDKKKKKSAVVLVRSLCDTHWGIKFVVMLLWQCRNLATFEQVQPVSKICNPHREKKKKKYGNTYINSDQNWISIDDTVLYKSNIIMSRKIGIVIVSFNFLLTYWFTRMSCRNV